MNQPGQGNIQYRSWTGKQKDIERLRCTACRCEFSERQGTLMEKTKLPEEKVIRLLKCQRWSICDAGTADICEVDIKTVQRFQPGAFQRAQEHHAQVVREVAAEAEYEQSLEVFREVGDHIYEGLALMRLSRLRGRDEELWQAAMACFQRNKSSVKSEDE